MTQIESLISISRHYGANPDYVIAGGGNTSFKDDAAMFIKASGFSMATIDEQGFVKMSREKLQHMADKKYPGDPVAREEEVKKDLYDAIISPENRRPSVETSLHNLIPYAYVVHTHPTLINAMMCGKHAELEVQKRFGNEALYVEYTDPGHILFTKLQSKLREYEEKQGYSPKIIFLQNHGIFVGADSTSEVKDLYDSIVSGVGKGCTLSMPDCQAVERSSEAADAVRSFLGERALMVQAYRSEMSDYFSASSSRFQRISRPFTPDIIVYCKSNYLFLEKGLSKETIVQKVRDFEERHAYYPKVIIEEKGGLILVEESAKALNTVREIFTDMMKISYLSKQFGGPSFMSDDQIAFIDNWEVENYRRSVAKS